MFCTDRTGPRTDARRSAVRDQEEVRGGGAADGQSDLSGEHDNQMAVWVSTVYRNQTINTATSSSLYTSFDIPNVIRSMDAHLMS